MKRRKFNLILIGFIVVIIGFWLYLFLPGILAEKFFPLPPEYIGAVKSYAGENKMSPCLLAAMINTESGWNPSARSSAGAVGMVQFMPATAAGWAKTIGIKNFSTSQLTTDPDLAIRMGSSYLKSLIDRNGGSVEDALMAYNGGQGAVVSKSTIGYARKVQSATDIYCATYPDLNQEQAKAAAPAPAKPKSLNDILLNYFLGT